MEHQAEALKNRTKQFALRIIRVIRSLSPAPEGRIISHQRLRSGMSVAANYRAVCRARSRPEFLTIVAIVMEQADESLFWLELLVARVTDSSASSMTIASFVRNSGRERA